MDSMDQINAPVAEPEDLSLATNHPGLLDPNYVRRRKMFFYLARDLRVRRLPLPKVHYTQDEEELWQDLSRRLNELHERAAATVYLRGKDALGLTSITIPQLSDLDALLFPRTGVHLVPAEGLLHGRIYFEYWSKRVMPCTLFLRHASQPEYTPEPDIVHDIIGHVPGLMDGTYAELVQLIGELAQSANEEELEKLVRFYWFTVEFGLIR